MEENPKLAWNINITALASFLNMTDGIERLFYVSSDSVYGESKDRYQFKEDDKLFPVNRYGIHKCCAEQLVTAYGYNVIRFPFLVGHSLIPERKHFYDTIVDSISHGKTVDMFYDSYRSTLDFDTATKLLLEVIKKPTAEVPQILNICGDEALSKYEIGVQMARILEVPLDLIRPISIYSDNNIFRVKRAASTLMDNSLLKRILGIDKIKISLLNPD